MSKTTDRGDGGGVTNKGELIDPESLPGAQLDIMRNAPLYVRHFDVWARRLLWLGEPLSEGVEDGESLPHYEFHA